MKVCENCFNDIEIKQFIHTNSSEAGVCDYCVNSSNSKLLDINELLDFFSEFFGIFKNDVHGISLQELIQKDWNLFSGENECINIIKDVLSVLDSSLINLNEPVNYTDEIIECVSYWEFLKDEIKWKRRFLINIDKLEELGWHRFLKYTIEIPKTLRFYRARLHNNSQQKKFQFKEMGCPNGRMVSAGRANPQGIPYLYLSKEIKTTIYEIRAAYLDEISVATYKISGYNRIILVDFTESPSAFKNVDKIVDYAKSMLLKRNISTDLSKPLRRYDSELEYIPTQFICEYIRYIAEEKPDGILFSSSLHQGGTNVVLFEQDKVKCISVKKYKVVKVEIESIKI